MDLAGIPGSTDRINISDSDSFLILILFGECWPIVLILFSLITSSIDQWLTPDKRTNLPVELSKSPFGIRALISTNLVG